jgi:hypothetical protein
MEKPTGRHDRCLPDRATVYSLRIPRSSDETYTNAGAGERRHAPMEVRMAAVPVSRPEMHAFRLAAPALRVESRFEVGTCAILTMLALFTWVVVLPLEFALRFTLAI